MNTPRQHSDIERALERVHRADRSAIHGALADVTDADRAAARAFVERMTGGVPSVAPSRRMPWALALVPIVLVAVGVALLWPFGGGDIETRGQFLGGAVDGRVHVLDVGVPFALPKKLGALDVAEIEFLVDVDGAPGAVVGDVLVVEHEPWLPSTAQLAGRPASGWLRIRIDRAGSVVEAPDLVRYGPR